ncbi:MAG: hypothetical protein H6839_05130 [Planctomycetes bacterium]|nr:hypothetical protein [Planctomycetota bacterium]
MRLLAMRRVAALCIAYLFCTAVVLLSVGCAATQGTAASAEPDGTLDEGYPLWDGQGMVCKITRPDRLEPGPDLGLVVDLTLLEIDAVAAKELLGIEGPTDIAPRRFSAPMGEIAGVNCAYGHGRVVDRPSMRLKDGVETLYEWQQRSLYLQDWELEEGGRASPVFGELTEGVNGKFLGKLAGDGGMQIQADFSSAQLVRPMKHFSTKLQAGKEVRIQIPELAVVHRVATETIQPGETAMFQLSRVENDDGSLLRLLFVRRMDSTE